MIKPLLEHLGIKIIRQEAAELVCQCPWCETDHMSVNTKTGAWRCFHGCGEGYPYQLTRKLSGLDAKGIFELLERFGLGTDSPTAARTQTEPPKHKRPAIKPEDIVPLTDEDVKAFSTAKSIDPAAFMTLRPMKHRTRPWVLIPANDPTDMDEPCGWIRVGIDGSPVEIKIREQPSGEIKIRLEKYPVVASSSPGLLGLHSIAASNPETIILAEGWRDALAARQLDYAATCNSQGALTWRDTWKAIFKDKIVYIIYDRDDAGIKGALKAANELWIVAREIRIIELPYEADSGSDLHDYIVRDKHTNEDFVLLLKTAPVFVPTSPESDDNTPEHGVDGVVVLPDDHPDTIAAAFEKQSKVLHRYNRYDGWSIFHNGKYQRVEDTKEIRLHIRKYLSKCYVTKKRAKIRLPKQSSGFVSDVLEALAALPDVHILPSKKAPCSLDGSLNAQHVIATNNELIDISVRPYKIQPVSKEFYTLNYLTYNYDKTAFSDKWGMFLTDICQSNLDLMELLQQWCGYLLLPTLKYQKFLLCVGDGANGKGVFFDTITAALGQRNVSNVSLARLESPYALFGTYGRMANMSNENAYNIENNAESVIKEYVAGDKILWEQKYKDAFFDYPTAKLMFATNELPKIRDVSDGIWRRMILVPFNAKFKPEDQNINLAKELQQPNELAAILNWMLEGAEILEKRGGFVAPEICKTALDKYRNESDSVRLFLADCIEEDPAVGTDDACQVPCTWLHQQYQKWCDDNGFKPKNNVHFGQTLHQLYRVQKSRPYFGNHKTNVYVGIKLTEGSEIAEELTKWTR